MQKRGGKLRPLSLRKSVALWRSLGTYLGNSCPTYILCDKILHSFGARELLQVTSASPLYLPTAFVPLFKIASSLAPPFSFPALSFAVSKRWSRCALKNCSIRSISLKIFSRRAVLFVPTRTSEKGYAIPAGFTWPNKCKEKLYKIMKRVSFFSRVHLFFVISPIHLLVSCQVPSQIFFTRLEAETPQMQMLPNNVKETITLMKL